MKLPSLSHLAAESGRTFRRFPLVLVNAAIGTTAVVIWIEKEATPQPFLMNVVLTTLLGLPLLTSLAVFSEKRIASPRTRMLLGIAGLILLVGYGLQLPEDVDAAPALHMIRFGLLILALHFLVAFAPFLTRGEINGFWQYNRTLFLRFLTAILFSGVLYSGLSIALASVDHLFGVDIASHTYFQLWAVTAGMFNTWFFLAGIPDDLGALEISTEYPKGLKVFTQYILIPLVVVYLVILYAYGVKIILEWDWPKGWVANLVLGFSITGVLSLLLLHPIQGRTENLWIRVFARRYYLALLPLVVMLLLAIMRRISDYGLTENRYFVLLLGLWLAGVALYFSFSTTKNIKVIPVSLCAMALLFSLGPWGAFAISEQSQRDRLRQILERTDVLVDGKVQAVQQPPSFDDAKEVSSILTYLARTHGLEGIREWLDERADPVIRRSMGDSGRSQSVQSARDVAALMGVPYIHEWQSTHQESGEFTTREMVAVPLEGYTVLVRGVHLEPGGSEPFMVSGSSYRIELSPSMPLLTVREMMGGSVAMDLGPLIQGLLSGPVSERERWNLSPDRLAVEAGSDQLSAKVYFRRLGYRKERDSLRVQKMTADILVGRAQ